MQNSITANNSNSQALALFIIISLISVPIATLGFGLYLLINEEKCSKSALSTIFFLLAASIGYINISKPVLESDLGYYYWLYNFAGEKSFEEYFALIPKEPLYHIFNYVMYYLTFGNFKLFMMVYTIIVYMLVFKSYTNVSKVYEIEPNYIVGAVMLMALFSEFQFYSSQIMRQVLAGAVAIYGISLLTTGEKKKTSLLIVFAAGLFHASAFFFLIYYVLYFTNRWKFGYQLAIFIALLLGYVSVLKLLGGFVNDTSTLSLAIQRGTAETSESGSIGILPLLICTSVLPMAILIMKSVDDRLLRSYLLMPSALVVYILLNLGNSLFVLRFMEYIYMFIPIVLTVFLTLYFRKVKQIQLLMIVFLAVRFGIKLGTSDFSFLSLSEFLFSGFPVYIFNIFL